ncbi:MAG: hypothetical protein IJD94_01955 [Clostridia bacterium]|nr:hypothetical protein [Clostridia bacterium]
MKRMAAIASFLLLFVLLCIPCFAQAEESINLYIHRDTLMACDLDEGRVLVYPQDSLRVMRASLLPWDEECTKCSLFVEVKNVSGEKIVVLSDTLYTCNSARESQSEAASIFDMTTNVIEPGERVVLFSGAYPYAKDKRRDSDALLDAQDVEGMADFAGKMEYAPYLRIRLETAGEESTRDWPKVELDAKAWIEDGKICFEWTNDTEEAQSFRTIGAVVSERNGRVTDVLMETYARGAQVEPGETFSAEKTLPPYFTQEMIDGATFKVFAYRMSN